MATRILVVDDSPTIRAVVSDILERSGFEPKVAIDGQDAYDALASGEVEADLLLVDFVMPKMNGFQLCAALREDARLQATPVVLMSARADRIRDEFVEQTGALDAITKPFDAEALVAVIENALRKVSSARSSTRLPAFDADETGRLGALPLAVHEQPRPDASQIVAQKLAAIVVRTIARRPEIASSSALAAVLAERLSKEAVVAMLESAFELAPRPSNRRERPLLEGDLGVVPIGAVLQLLQAENQTGTLVCTHQGAEISATFRDGGIDLVQSTGAGDEFRLGRFFVEAGILTPGEIESLLQVHAAPEPVVELSGPDTLPWGRSPSISPVTQRESHGAVTWRGSAITAALAAATEERRPLGMALLALGRIDEAQLRAALIRQSSELLYEVLRWPGGRFELRREPASELAEQARLGLPVASVVMEGFRRVDEWRVLERTLGSFDGVLLRDDTAFGRLALGSLPPKERAVLEAIDGERTVRAIVAASHLSSFDACRILVQLLEARVVRRRAR